MIEELSAVIAIKTQKLEREPIFHVFGGMEHSGRTLIPYRPAFGPGRENIGIGQAPNEVSGQAGSAVGHAISFQIAWAGQVPGSGSNRDLASQQGAWFGAAAASARILRPSSGQKAV